MERLFETSIGTRTQLHISRKQVGLKLGSLSHKPMVVLKDKMKVGMDWRGKKEVEGETEEAWEEVKKRRWSQTSKGKLCTLKETGDECRDVEGEGSRSRANQARDGEGKGSSSGENQGQDRGEGSASGENQGGDRNAEGSRSNDDKDECERHHRDGGDIEQGVQENNLEVIDFSGIPQAFLAIIGVITVAT
nr:hypothetical protein CFP56_29636 [Quercus suber]